ncbi:MAG: hypothetical protein ACI8QC_004455 [Planctomycetota bacterium]|jgi:hypothetical protein
MELHQLRAVASRFWRGRYAMLGLALLSLAFAYPVLGFGLPGLSLWTLAFWSVLLGALHAIGIGPRLRWIARTLAVFAICAGIAGLACYQLRQTNHAWVFALFDGLTLLFLALATGVTMVDVFLRETLDTDHLMGAACVYILLALTFAYALPVIDFLSTDPILAHMDPTHLRPTDPGGSRAEYLYFSFVTLSTLGYGDLVPASLAGRLVASMEAIVGQLFLTILVARLIGLHLMRANGRPSDLA